MTNRPEEDDMTQPEHDRPEAEPDPCDRADLPELGDMMCGGCGAPAGDHPAWQRQYGRRRHVEQDDAA